MPAAVWLGPVLIDTFRTDPRDITKVVAHPEYRKHEPHLVSFMARSREFRADPVQLLYLQAEMAREVIHLQAEQRDYQAKTDAGELEQYRYIAAVCRQLAHGIRQVADGIAWRSLGYDRGAIHELAWKPQSGHMNLETALQEIEAAAKHVEETGELVVLNDLTNFLRYGDFTSIGQGITIHEVKAGRGSAKSGRAHKQKKRTDEVIEFIARRERQTNGGLEKLVRLRAKPRAYLERLPALISQARESGSAHARLSDCLAVEVFDLKLIADAYAAGKVRFHNPFAQSKDTGTSHSLELFDKFTPNMAPYSVFPLSSEDCVGIMTGSLWLFTYFNKGNFVRCLRRRGLRVRFPSEDELKAAPKWMPGQVADHELDNPVVIMGSAHVVLLSLGLLSRMIDELLDEETFADMIEEQLHTAGGEKELVYLAFEDETDLWD